MDFIAIETLRIFYPDVYDGIRRNSGRFTGHKLESNHGGQSATDIKAYYDAIASKAPGKEYQIQRMLTRLFPKLDSVYGNMSWGADRELEWRRQLRVCSADIFPTYFSFAVASGDITAEELQDAVSAATTEHRFSSMLVDFSNQLRTDGMTRVRPFLDRFLDYTSTLEEAKIFPVIRAFFNVGDQLLRPEDERRFMFDEENFIRLARIAVRLIERLDEPVRFTTLRDAFANGKSITSVVRFMFILKSVKEKDEPNELILVSEEQWNELKEIVLNKIRIAAKDGTLLGVD